MNLISPVGEHAWSLPQAYEGCTCSCHRQPNVMHCVPCCYPGMRRLFKKYDDGEAYRRSQESNEGTEFSNKDGVNFDKRED